MTIRSVFRGVILAPLIIGTLLLQGAEGGGDPSAGMVKIPAGWFIMGSDDGPPDSRPQRRIYLDAYYIDKYEVTNAQYKEFMDRRIAARKSGKRLRILAPNCELKMLTTPNSRQIWNREEKTYPEEYANHPVTCVSWIMADFYCEDLGKKLPTEAQWEKAARGTKGFLYPWGNEWNPEYSNSGLSVEPWGDGSDGYERTAPVGSFPKDVSPYGVYDLAGNVWEWTRDMYTRKYYKWGPNRNPTGPTPETAPKDDLPFAPNSYIYTRRGGSWAQNAESSISYLRASRLPTYRDDAGGFRCVKEIK